MTHPDDALLAAYSAGTLAHAQDFLVACHLSRCPQCRDQVALLDEIGGLLLDLGDTTPSAEDALLSILGRLDDEPTAEPAPREAAPLPPELLALDLPEPLRSTLARSGVTQWATVVPGFVHQITLPIPWEGEPVRLTRVRGGFRVPRHTHRGRELNLVLAGGFRDPSGGYGPGDVAENDDSVTHELAIDPGEDCIILAVNESPLVPVGLTARVASWLVGF